MPATFHLSVEEARMQFFQDIVDCRLETSTDGSVRVRLRPLPPDSHPRFNPPWVQGQSQPSSSSSSSSIAAAGASPPSSSGEDIGDVTPPPSPRPQDAERSFNSAPSSDGEAATPVRAAEDNDPSLPSAAAVPQEDHPQLPITVSLDGDRNSVLPLSRHQFILTVSHRLSFSPSLLPCCGMLCLDSCL